MSIEEDLMWMATFVEREEVVWLVTLWLVEGLQKWDFSTHVAKPNLLEDDPSMVE